MRRVGYPVRCATYDNREPAVQWAREAEQSMRDRLWFDPTAPRQTSIHSAIERSCSEVLPGKRSQHPVRSAAHHLAQKLGQYTLWSLSPGAIREYRDQRLQQARPQILIHELSVLSRIYIAARREWHLEVRKPTREVPWPVRPDSRDRRLDWDSALALLTSARDFEHTQRRTIPIYELIVLALQTGMRRGEIAAIRRHHINRRAGSLRIQTSKKGPAREIPLTRRARRALSPATGARRSRSPDPTGLYHPGVSKSHCSRGS